MEYLIYISTASKLLDDAELTDILVTSCENNKRYDLTGMLLYSQGTFIQFLEGPADNLNTVFEHIVNDGRHKNVIKLTQEQTPKRHFTNWTMGFRRLSTDDQQVLEGHFDPRRIVLQNDQDHPGISLIRTFAENDQHEFI